MLVDNFRDLIFIFPPVIGFKTKFESSESEVEIFFFNFDTLDFGVFLDRNSFPITD